MIWIYRLLFLPVFILSVPYFLWHMKRRGGYEQGLNQRFGHIPDCGEKVSGKKRLWIQAVSVGEVRALKALLQGLAMNPSVEVILTTTTSTGYHIAKDNYRDLVKAVFYFPIDFAPFNRKAWNRIQPDLCILTEGELWPEHIYRAKQRKVPIVLINARISDRSIRIYKVLGGPARRLFRSLSLILASSQGNADRFRELGCSYEKILCLGNLKCDIPIPQLLSEDDKHKLNRELGLPSADCNIDKPVVLCGASTWPGEEAILFRICKRIRQDGIDLRLLITPRHVERRESVKSELLEFNFKYHFRSEGSAQRTGEVAIADTTGELTKFLQISDIVFIGRSLPPHKGGQTPIEAGMLKKPILFGPEMSNFREIARSLLRFGIAEEVKDETALEKAVRNLCEQPELRDMRGEKADQWLESNQGATERTLEALGRILS